MGLLVNTMRTEEKMNETQIREQIEGLRHMTVGQLKEKYRGAFGEESGRITSSSSSGGSPGACRRTLGVGCRNGRAGPRRSPTTPISASGRRSFLKGELDPKRTAERASSRPGSEAADSRHDAGGATGQDIVVRVREDGLEYNGKVHRSLRSGRTSATARRGTGSRSSAGQAGRKHGNN
jgi:hypothetical protein